MGLERRREMTAATREEARLGWMALTLTPGMGPTRIGKAVKILGAAEQLFEASLTELEMTGMPGASAQFIFDGRAREAAENEMKRVAEAGGTILTPDDEAYPERLREIYDPPAVLWIRGDVESADAAGNCGGGDAASFALWRGDGGDAVARSGEPAAGDFERDGARRGYGGAQGSA